MPFQTWQVRCCHRRRRYIRSRHRICCWCRLRSPYWCRCHHRFYRCASTSATAAMLRCRISRLRCWRRIHCFAIHKFFAKINRCTTLFKISSFFINRTIYLQFLYGIRRIEIQPFRFQTANGNSSCIFGNILMGLDFHSISIITDTQILYRYRGLHQGSPINIVCQLQPFFRICHIAQHNAGKLSVGFLYICHLSVKGIITKCPLRPLRFVMQ